MNIRWRLCIVALQLAILVLAANIATGNLYSAATWFTAGLLSVVINSQLLEPFYSRPADVIGNVAICFLLYLTTTKHIAQPAWTLFLVLLIVALVFAVLALVFGAGKSHGKLVPLARFAKQVSVEATAVRIYSIAFWLSLIESYPSLEKPLWIMGIAWGIIVAIGSVDWQKAWETLTGKSKECSIEGMIGPSRIVVSSSDLPAPGNWVKLKVSGKVFQGAIISRIQRVDDVWGQIFMESQQDCEFLIKSRNTVIEFNGKSGEVVLGIADAGSNQENLVFFPNRPLEIGNVVSIQNGISEILYQIYSAQVQKIEIKGGAHLQVQAQAKQLGIFDVDSYRLKPHYWVPNPGSSVTVSNLKPTIDETKLQDSWILIGHVIGTEVPVYFDVKLAGEGHLAILGMTKMGKTTLAVQIMNALAKGRIVTVLDQTSEYRKRGIPLYTQNHDTAKPGIALLEPKITTDKTAAIEAYDYLQRITNIARSEFEMGNPRLRTILVEEAHQFVPEPTGMDFRDRSRECTQKFGALMMQIRKYGISIILISQRTAVVAKSALSQCENIIAFRSVDKTGLEYLETVAGHELSSMLPLLKQGQALVFGPAFSCDVPVAIKTLLPEKSAPSPEDGQPDDNVPQFLDSDIPF